MGARLFVAVAAPAVAVEHLDAAVARVRADDLPLSWIPPDRWHLTLAFFGDIEVARVDDLSQRLARVASRHDCIELRFRGVGAFSRPAAANVLWAGIEGPVEQLRALASSCAAAGRRVGAPVEERLYRPHLTLARTKGRQRVDVRPLVDELASYVGPDWTASDLQLMESHLGPKPRYDVVGSWPLRSDYQA